MITRTASLLAATLALALAGCPKKSSTPAAEDPVAEDPVEAGPGCDLVAEQTFTAARADHAADSEKAAYLGNVVLKMCTDGAWSATARSCMAEATDHGQLDECAQRYLSDDEYRRLGQEFERIFDDSTDGQIGLPPE